MMKGATIRAGITILMNMVFQQPELIEPCFSYIQCLWLMSLWYIRIYFIVLNKCSCLTLCCFWHMIPQTPFCTGLLQLKVPVCILRINVHTMTLKNKSLSWKNGSLYGKMRFIFVCSTLKIRFFDCDWLEPFYDKALSRLLSKCVFVHPMRWGTVRLRASHALGDCASSRIPCVGGLCILVHLVHLMTVS